MKTNSIVEHESYEKLLKEFHPTKNGDIKLSDFSYGSQKKVWWECSVDNEHEWESEIRGRVKGNGCVYCSGKKIVTSNCLATTHPDIAKQWHPTKNGELKPIDVVAGSNIKVWWKCNIADDHEWETTINNRINSNGCKCCSGYKVVKSNCLLTTHPKLAAQWHPVKNRCLTSSDFVATNSKKIWWKCDIADDHEWEAKIFDRAKGSSCPCCSGHKTVESNCLSTTHSELVKEWHPEKNEELVPGDVIAGGNKKVWWRCKFNSDHEWKAKISSRTSTFKTNCPHCMKSKGQLEIERVLNEYNIIYETEKTFEGCRSKNLLRFDTYIQDINTLIEFDGRHHFEPIEFMGGEKSFEGVKKRDKIKDEYCKNNNIHLLRIPYTQFNNIKIIILDYLENITNSLQTPQ